MEYANMIQYVVFINLFFVPILPLYLIYRKKQKPLAFGLELLFQYCIISACNIPLTKVFIFLAKKLGGVFVSIDSGYYTLAALGAGFLLPRLYAFFKTVRIEVEVRKNEESKKTK